MALKKSNPRGEWCRGGERRAGRRSRRGSGVSGVGLRAGRPRLEERRGVVLLIVISLLMLFSLVAVTFAIVAGQFKHAAVASAKQEMVGDPPKKDLDTVMYTLLRDTTTRSSLQGHSLLKDLYDSQTSVIGRVTGYAATAGGQFRNVSFDQTISPQFSIDVGAYNGCVFTFLTGAARGFSTRVVGYGPVPGGVGTIRIEAPDGEAGVAPVPAVGDFFLINDRAFNGTGFGYNPNPGAGKTPGIEALDSPQNPGAQLASNGSPLPVAMLPHFAGYTFPTPQAIDQGGADESWDAPDFNNMMMAMVPAASAAAPDALPLSHELLPSFHRPDLIGFWFKWLRQNKLQNLTAAEAAAVFRAPLGPDNLPNTSDDWTKITLADAQNIVAFKRQFIFRPLPEDHPNFSGSNPRFDILMGSQLGNPDVNGDTYFDLYDVDNDNDGVPDSIWIDPGLPIATSPDGRQYKKLVAVLVKDLDGRINLNTAEGSRDTNRLTSVLRAQAGTFSVEQSTVAGTFLQQNTNPLRLHGQGFGPAELTFAQLFETIGVDIFNKSGTPTAVSEYVNLLTGRYASRNETTTATRKPGITNQDDFLSALKNPGWPASYLSSNSIFRAPIDQHGIHISFLDYHGRPNGMLLKTPGPPPPTGPGDGVDEPYEMNPVEHRNEDSFYAVAELERLLRHNDADRATLPSRLHDLAPNLFAHPQVRSMVTTHSMHIPVPNMVLPPELRAAGSTLSPPNRPISMVDLYRIKLRPASNGKPATWMDDQLRRIVPFEIQHGQLFNINRRIGNGLDDDGNYVADDIWELPGTIFPGGGTSERIWTINSPAFQGSTTFGNYQNDTPTLNGGPLDPRQILARHLYCLAWLLVDENYQQVFKGNKNLTPQEMRQLTARRLAQWAINVVDFRDADAACTAFEYSVYPFDGWDVDGNIATANAVEGERGVVWGTEAPELLITETFATHNRGVKDTEHEAPNAKKRAVNNKQTDDDLDQFRQPQGSLFVELYCPSAEANEHTRAPAEIYDNNPQYSRAGVDLGRLAPPRKISNQDFTHPVWRLVVTKTLGKDQAISDLNRKLSDPYAYNFDPRDPIDRLVSNAPGNITFQQTERIIWFAPLDPTGYPEQNQVFYGRSGGYLPQLTQQKKSNLVLPTAAYAVIGPRPDTRFGSLKLGADSDASTYDPVPESVQLNATNLTIGFGGGYAANYPQNADSNNPNLVPNVIQQPLGIICAAKPPANWNNQTRLVGMNVSEPLPQSGQYYAEPNPANDARLPADAYADTTMPFDPMANFVPDAPYDDQLNIIGGGNGNNGSDMSTRTIIAHRSLFLQRLANPLLPWNPEPTDPEMAAFYDATIPVNPYLTVDFSDIDLQVFSGEEDTTQTVMINNQQEPIDPSDSDTSFDKFDKDGGFIYASRERGAVLGGNAPVATSPENTLLFPPWTARRDNPNQVGGTGDYNFPQTLLPHSLGYINWMVAPALNNPATGFEGAVPLNAPHRFPWLTINNRPFANPYELLLVPSSSPSRLLTEFSEYSVALTGNGPPTPRGLYLEVQEGYQHLLNFFHAYQETTPAMNGQPGASQQLVRLLDYIETPSPYLGTEKWYPATLGATSFATAVGAETFRPPYNYLSRFRDPGRININTIFDYREFHALTALFEHYNNHTTNNQMNNVPELFNRFVESRRGYGLSEYGDYPTIFANPVRTAMSADLMPDVKQMRKKNGVEATLLRPDPLTVNGGQPPQPLFDFFHPDPNQSSVASNDKSFETYRNPFFRYRGLARLSNLVSTHSNVYAIWLTLGYFEVEPHGGIDAGHPDGMRIGRELGLDQGTAERHRAFYMIDRSVPVAFQPGFDHNVDRAVMIRRVLE